MIRAALQKVFGTYHDRERKRLWPVVEQINALESAMKGLSDEALRAKTDTLRAHVREELAKEVFPTPAGSEWYDLNPDERAEIGKKRRKHQQRVLDGILPEAFASS